MKLWISLNYFSEKSLGYSEPLFSEGIGIESFGIVEKHKLFGEIASNCID